MKKGFQILSLLFLATWLVGYFILNAGIPIHACLAISLLFFIQSVITLEARTENEPKPGF